MFFQLWHILRFGILTLQEIVTLLSLFVNSLYNIEDTALTSNLFFLFIYLFEGGT